MDFAVYGLFDIECGLRVAAENTVRALDQGGHRVSKRSIQPDGRVVVSGDQVDAKRVNLFHANPDWLLRMLSTLDGESLGAAHALNVFVPFWELPHLPEAWTTLTSAMDLVLAPTSFIADAVRTSVPETRVLALPQAVHLPQGIAPARQRFGVPEHALAFVVSFDADSGVERKNPWAGVDAFIRAFPERDDVTLVVRTHAAGGLEPQGLMRDLLRLAESDRRVRLVQGAMEYRDVLSLYASCDVYVSLHRSEGLGLGPMEAMSLGRAVIATGWSGNMDYMTVENSFPVCFDLVPVVVPEGSPYAELAHVPGVSWAEPRIEHAAELMRRLAADRPLQERVAERAARDMESRRDDVLRGGFLSEIDRLLKGLPGDAAHPGRAAQIEALRLEAHRNAGRPASSVLRRAFRSAAGLFR